MQLKVHFSSGTFEDQDQDETKRTSVVESSSERSWCTNEAYVKRLSVLSFFFSFLMKKPFSK